ncbi:hypothetical protein BLA29_004399, partial [Euroglyphus maynei]
MNVLSSMTSNLAQKAAGSANQTGSMFNSIGQLSTSFPNSIKPMNQLINQFHPGSFTNIGGIGPRSTGPGPPSSSSSTTTNFMANNTSSAALNAVTSSSSNAITKSPIPSQVPEVDLSGLTEEEKQMIQSVMARAQQDTQMPNTPQAPLSTSKISTTT